MSPTRPRRNLLNATADISSATCPLCAALVQIPPLTPGDSVRCPRCKDIVTRQTDPAAFQVAWALASAGLILLVLANLYPIMTFDVVGNTQSNHIATGIIALWGQGYWPVAALILFCAAIAPIGHLGAVWYASAACSIGRRLPAAAAAARLAARLEAWSLIPVFAVACMVAVVKLDLLGSVAWQAGIYWVAALAACTIVMTALFNPEQVEIHLESLPRP